MSLAVAGKGFAVAADGPVADGPVADGPVADGPVADGPVGDTGARADLEQIAYDGVQALS